MQHLGVDNDVRSEPYYWDAGNMEVRALDLNSRLVLLPVDLVLFVSIADNYLDCIQYGRMLDREESCRGPRRN
jgi:hypothetical protein